MGKNFPGNVSKKKGLIGGGNDQGVTMNPQQVMQMITNHVVKNQESYSDMVCKCGCVHFERVVRAKHVSTFDPINAMEEPVVVTIQVWLCRDCHNETRFLGSDANAEIRTLT